MAPAATPPALVLGWIPNGPIPAIRGREPSWFPAPCYVRKADTGWPGARARDRTSARTRRTSPAAGACASAAEAPHASATRPARDAATAEPAALAELFQVNASVRAAG